MRQKAASVVCRSDLTGANIEGADFTNALVDRTQQMALCKYAGGMNPETGGSLSAEDRCSFKNLRIRIF